MNYIIQWIAVISVCLVGLPTISSAFPRQDPIVIDGAQFQELHGVPLDQLALYRVSESATLDPIPYQLDEKTYDSNRGDFQYNLTYAADGHPLIGDGRWHAQDELAFMSQDVGARLLSPPSPSFTHLYEIAVRDPMSQRVGYAYFAHLNSGIHRRSTRTYVAYNRTADEVKTAVYKTAFLPKAPFAQAELVLFNRRDGESTNVLDRFKMRSFLDLRSFFNMSFKEEDVTSKRLGDRQGPIRIIRRLVTYQKLGPIRVTPKAMSDYIFYQDRLEIPSTIVAPFDPKSHLKEGSFSFGGFDFSHGFFGSQFYAEHNPHPVAVDGVMGHAEQALARADVKWWVVTGEKGHLVVKVSPDDRLVRQGVTFKLFYEDNENTASPPETEFGSSMIGFEINPRELPKGSFDLVFHQFFPPSSFKKGDEARYLEASRALSYTIKLFRIAD